MMPEDRKEQGLFLDHSVEDNIAISSLDRFVAAGIVRRRQARSAVREQMERLRLRLNAIGLPELVTNSLDEYEALALRLARGGSLLRELRYRLEQNRLREPLFDTNRFCRHIEAAYTMMWERWQRGESPQGFSVQPHQDSMTSASATI